MLWIANKAQGGLGGSEISEAKNLINHLQNINITAINENLHLMVVIPCEHCPHERRCGRELDACAGAEKRSKKKDEEILMGDEMEAAEQLMELSRQSLTSSKSSLIDVEALESSLSRRSCGFALTPSPSRVSADSLSSRKVAFDVEVDERREPRSRYVSEICDQRHKSKAFKRKRVSVGAGLTYDRRRLS